MGDCQATLTARLLDDKIENAFCVNVGDRWYLVETGDDLKKAGVIGSFGGGIGMGMPELQEQIRSQISSARNAANNEYPTTYEISHKVKFTNSK